MLFLYYYKNSWQSLTVPLQGFLNALVYAWTKEDFLKVMGILHVNDDIVEYYDNDDLSDEDLEQSVEECHTPRELEDSVTISIKSMPAMGSADHSSYQRRKESHVTRDYEHSSDHGGYNTY